MTRRRCTLSGKKKAFLNLALEPRGQCRTALFRSQGLAIPSPESVGGNNHMMQETGESFVRASCCACFRAFRLAHCHEHFARRLLAHSTASSGCQSLGSGNALALQTKRNCPCRHSTDIHFAFRALEPCASEVSVALRRPRQEASISAPGVSSTH